MQKITQERAVYPSSGRGPVRPARVREGTVLICTGGACSRGYKRGERGREAPKSLLEVDLLRYVPISGSRARVLCECGR